MVLYVVRVPDPEPGADWSTMVPGQYLWNITGITAQLATRTVNGQMYAITYDATIGETRFYVDGVPFGTVTDAVAPLAAATDAVLLGGSLSGTSVFDEFALYSNPLAPTDIATIYDAAFLGYPTYESAVIGFGPDAYYQCDPFPGADIMVDISGNGNDIPYFDPTNPSQSQVAGIVPGNLAISNNGSYIGQGPNPGTGNGSFTIVGWINTDTLNPGQLLCFFEDGALNGYCWVEALNQPGQPLMRLHRVIQVFPIILEQIFDSDVGQWSGGGGAGIGREVGLDVTDGTHLVARLGSGFPVSASSGPFGYSWLPTARSNTQSADGTVTTIAIPRLVLPAGYTVGTFTPDLGPLGQWSDVTVWWDDDIQAGEQPTQPYEFPPGALLQYHQIGT